MIDPPSSGLGRFIKPFFALTKEERQILCLVLALALLGLAVWAWRAAHRPPDTKASGAVQNGSSKKRTTHRSEAARTSSAKEQEPPPVKSQ